MQEATPSRQKSPKEKFIKDAFIQWKPGVQIKRQLAEISAVNKEKNERRRRSQRQL